MLQTALRRGVGLVASALLVAACGGSPSGPSGNAIAGTATFDGQTIQFSSRGSGAFRRPANPAWPSGLIDLSLINCGRPPGVIMALYDGNPTPGVYEVGSVLSEGAEGSLQSPAEQWRASPTLMGSGGSITVSSASPTRISGSFAFTLVQQDVPPPRPTKHIEGTFDLEFTDGSPAC